MGTQLGFSHPCLASSREDLSCKFALLSAAPAIVDAAKMKASEVKVHVRDIMTVEDLSKAKARDNGIQTRFAQQTIKGIPGLSR